MRTCGAAACAVCGDCVDCMNMVAKLQHPIQKRPVAHLNKCRALVLGRPRLELGSDCTCCLSIGRRLPAVTGGYLLTQVVSERSRGDRHHIEGVSSSAEQWSSPSALTLKEGTIVCYFAL
ncbi:hypothetical protein Ahy_A03g014298 isoform C [Arachis hypogaea]|uniref:Uncharacterized protein n=1 Tax=Arachis hypogaea TaxID=3818 RepID=A0A445DXQ0_ARAHY|nr:hypothetical protein Ahy_A03g014298 isoform C [Arachis hypogaea]